MWYAYRDNASRITDVPFYVLSLFDDDLGFSFELWVYKGCRGSGSLLNAPGHHACVAIELRTHLALLYIAIVEHCIVVQ